MRLSTSYLTSIAIMATLSPSWGFQTSQVVSSPRVSTSPLGYSNWDAFETRDSMELMIGGTRYEMVELPDSMMSTTLWVGNLCEFVTDEMLSELFQQTSSLKFVPACVARKPNMESLRYGFVTFRSEEEKETAMDLLHGYELQGKCLKVEPIKDHAKYGRIRAPQKIVDYAVGPIKRQRKGELNTMRRATATSTRIWSSDDDEDDGGSGYRQNRARRQARVEKRKSKGRYKNQQRKNSRASRMLS
ncbi:hypothetical protein ACHAXR_003324 [Thalassiosira sp. AJA248-18]